MQLMLVNPAKRGSKKRSKTMARKTRRKSKRRAARRKTSSVTRRTSVTRRYRRNPRRRRASGRGLGGIINKNLMPSLAGGAGALGLDLILGYAPIPDNMKTGPLSYAVKFGGALGLGWLAGMVVKKETAQHMTNGAMTVIAYDAMKNAAKTAMPNLPLSAYESDYGMGAYLNAYQGPALQMDDENGVGNIFDDGSIFENEMEYDQF